MKIPRLRFKGFSDSWQMKPIAEILSIGSGKDYKTLGPGEIPVYGTGGYMLSVNDYLYDGESVCIGRKGTIDKPILLNGKFWTVDTLFYTHSFKECIPSFIYPLFQRINWKNYNEASGVPSLSKSTIEKIDVYLPGLGEQLKIASFLSEIDQKISLLSQKYKFLIQYKKGVMQKIFSQEIRFKDKSGKDFPGWRKIKLGEFAEFYRGGQLAKSHLDNNGKNMCIHYGELFTIYSEIVSEIKSKTNIDDGFFGKSGDIVMPSSDVTPDGLARASCLMLDKVILGGDMNIIRPNAGLDSPMLSYLLNFYKNKVVKLVSGTTVKHIYIKDIKEIEFTLPSSLDEQIRISNFLIEIDKKIKLTASKIELTKQFKQGLLQQMFI